MVVILLIVGVLVASIIATVYAWIEVAHAFGLHGWTLVALIWLWACASQGGVSNRG